MASGAMTRFARPLVAGLIAVIVVSPLVLMVMQAMRTDAGSWTLANLQFAVEKGFDGWDHMAGDVDLKALHDDAEFEGLFPDGNVPTPALRYER